MVNDWFFGRSVQHHSDAAVLVVLDQEYHGAMEVGIEQQRCGEQQTSLE